MTDIPNVKIKTLVSFPSNVIGGTGISIDKANGNFTIDLNYSEFVFQGTLPTGSNVLVWDPVANIYTLVPPSATGGISDAPTDGKVYGRQYAGWVDAWDSVVLTGNPTAPTPSPGDNDTSVATTAFVAAAVAAPATATPLADGAGGVGVSLKYAREDHVHPAGAAGSGDVVGPSSAVDSNLAAFDTTTGKLIKDSGSAASSFATPSSVVTAISNAAVRYDLPQTLTTPQQTQARNNISSVGVIKIRTITASGTYTPSAGLIYCVIEAVGGGGSGGNTTTTSSALVSVSGGGGGGGYAKKLSTAADIGASQVVTIGAGGAPVGTGGSAGQAGGNTSVGTLCVASGGAGGNGGGASSAAGVSGSLGGIGLTGDVLLVGSPSIYAAATATPVPNGTASNGGGAGGGFGAGGIGTINVTGGNGRGYGGGGGGVLNAPSTAQQAGGNGSNGVVIITEYCTQ